MYIKRSTRRILKHFLFSVSIIVVVFAVGGGLYVLTDNDVTGYSVLEEEIIKNEETVHQHFSIERDHTFTEDPFSIEDYEEMEVLVAPGRVIFSKNCTAISVAVTLEKSERLARSLDREYPLRPTEHDVLEEIIDYFDITVDYVTINKLENNIFYADLFLHDEKALKLDIRPSDALAIVLRFGAPVYVHKQLIQEHAKEIC